MSSPGEDNSESRNSSNRIRVSIACQHCRLRKIKCDGAVPCRKCTESGIICQPGAKRKKRAPSRKCVCVLLAAEHTDLADRDQYIRELEKRLQDAESLRLDPSTPEGRGEIDDGSDGAESQSGRQRHMFPNGMRRERGNIGREEHQYFGASSTLGWIEGEALHLQRTISEPDARTASEISECPDVDHPAIIGHHAYDDDLDTNLQAVQAQLPSPDIVQKYIDEYFRYFALRCPILDESDFRAKAAVFMQAHPQTPVLDSFVSVFLMVLCFGEYFSSNDKAADDVSHVAGWKFFLSAYSNVRDGLRGTNIEYMQSAVLQVCFAMAY